jgi:hypothetical protein
MNMDTYGDDHGFRSLGDTNSRSKSWNYHALEEDQTHDVASSGEHVLVARYVSQP